MKIYGTKLVDNMDGHCFDRLCSGLTQERQARIRQYFHKEDAQRAAFAELMLRQIIREKLQWPEEKIVFGYHQYGKPFLLHGANFHFNISHSGRWVVCVIDNEPVGIDIELIRPVDLRIARKYFSPAEYENLMAKDEKDQLEFFFTRWTRKESYLKAIGAGLSKLSSSMLETEIASGGWFFKQYRIEEDYSMTVCAAHEEFPEGADIEEIRISHPKSGRE